MAHQYGAARMTTLQAKTFDGSVWQHRIAYFSANAATSDPTCQRVRLTTRDDQGDAQGACIMDDYMVRW